MRIVAVDASPIPGGSVSAAVEAAAVRLERAGAAVDRVRLYERLGGRPSPSSLELRALVEEVCAADALVAGSPAYFGGLNSGTLALLQAYRAHIARLRNVSGMPLMEQALPPGKRAALVTAAADGPLRLLGLSGLACGRIRSALAEGGMRTAGTLVVPGTFDGPADKDVALTRAARLAERLLAALPRVTSDRSSDTRYTRRLVPVTMDL